MRRSEELTPDTANSVTTEAFQEAIDVPDFAVLRNNFVVPPEENSSGEKKSMLYVVNNCLGRILNCYCRR